MMSQRVERTWIRTGGYGQFRGEWVNVPSPTKMTAIPKSTYIEEWGNHTSVSRFVTSIVAVG